MKPFRERNPVPIGILSMAFTVGLVAVAFDVQNLPPFRGTTYRAEFADAGDLTVGNEVRIAGVRVGAVKKISLKGSHVEVAFSVKGDGVALGTATSAVIKLKTVVGARYLELDPDGPGTMSPSTPIPLSRTDSPFSITQAFNGLSQRIQDIDTKQLAQSFDVISSAFADTPALNKQALTGLERLSHTVASRDQQLKSLLTDTQSVVGTINDRDADLQLLIDNAQTLLTAVQQRRVVIDSLLTNTSALAQQLTGLAQDNTVVLNSALGHVNAVLTTLEGDRTQLDQTIQLLAPYTRLFADTLGNGRWFDVVLYGLVPNLDLGSAVSALGCTSINGQANPLCDVATGVGSAVDGVTGALSGATAKAKTATPAPTATAASK